LPRTAHRGDLLDFLLGCAQGRGCVCEFSVSEAKTLLPLFPSLAARQRIRCPRGRLRGQLKEPLELHRRDRDALAFTPRGTRNPRAYQHPEDATQPLCPLAHIANSSPPASGKPPRETLPFPLGSVGKPFRAPLRPPIGLGKSASGLTFTCLGEG